MITIKTEELNAICNKVLYALDTNGLSSITETLELILEDNVLHMQITNREYFLKIKLDTGTNEDFHATVNAEVFLKLIPKFTTELISMDIEKNCLIVIGNGEYKLPMIYEDANLLELPEITIDNETNSFNIKGSILNSIHTFNSKQLAGKTVMSPLQTLYYVDKNGAITFTSGACVNDFELEQDVKLLLNQKLVKLFKLFKDEDVKFTIGQDAVAGTSQTQTKVKFESDDIELTAILPSNDADIAKFPAQVIRSRATKSYVNHIIINRLEMLQAINRLSIFSEGSTALNRNYFKFEFDTDKVILYDVTGNNFEEIFYANSTSISEKYVATLDFTDVKSILEVATAEFLNFEFGDHQAIVCTQDNIHNVIPEVE